MKRLIVFLSVLLVIIILFNGISLGVFAVEIDDDFCSCGYHFDDMPAVSEANYIPSPEDEILPSQVDLSEDYSFPPVGDQKWVGSCVVWATTYYQFGYQVAKMNNWDAKHDYSKCFSPRYIHNYLNIDENQGTNHKDVYEVLKQIGAVRYDEFTPLTYPNGDGREYLEWYDDRDDMKEALRYRIDEYYKIEFADDEDMTPITSPDSSELYLMKKRLSEGNILSFEAPINSWKYDTLPQQTDSSLTGQYICYDCSESYNGHGMVIVGYNDDIWYDLDHDEVVDDFEKGAFKVANSWGTGYKNNGFVWLLYDSINLESNYSGLNTPNRADSLERYRTIMNNIYYYISVRECPLYLTADVTLNQSKKCQTELKIGTSLISHTSPDILMKTFLNKWLGNSNYDGYENNSFSERTFVFDLLYFPPNPNIRNNYYLDFIKSANGNGAEISSISINDKNDDVLASDSNYVFTSNETEKIYRYKIGLIGDVNDDGVVDGTDGQLIQMYRAHMISFSNEEEIVADVDRNGIINVIDSSYINLCLYTNPELLVGNYISLE